MGNTRMPLVWLTCAAWAGTALAQNNPTESTRIADRPPSQGEPAVASAAGVSLDLATALRHALARSPELAASRLEAEAMQHEVDQAGVLPNPELGLEVEDASRRERATTVALSQRLETGGKRAARVKAAQKASDLAQAQVQQQQVETRAAVTAAFFDTLIAQERVELARESLKLAQVGTTVADKRVLSGKVSPVELTKAQVAQAQTRMELARAEGELQASLHALQAALGDGMGVSRVDGQALQAPKLPDAQALLDRAEQAPARRRAGLEVQRWSAVAEVERSKRTPDVTVSLGLKRAEDVARNQLMLGVSVPLPLFDRNQGSELAALKRRNKAEEEARALALKQRMDVLSARQRWLTATRSAELMRQEVLPGAQTAYAAATKGFSLGKFSYLEALDAQRTLLEARTQYLSALADAYRAASDVERLIGEPLSGATASGSSPSNASK